MPSGPIFSPFRNDYCCFTDANERKNGPQVALPVIEHCCRRGWCIGTALCHGENNALAACQTFCYAIGEAERLTRHDDSVDPRFKLAGAINAFSHGLDPFRPFA
jgi:hypothetical protein